MVNYPNINIKKSSKDIREGFLLPDNNEDPKVINIDFQLKEHLLYNSSAAHNDTQILNSPAEIVEQMQENDNSLLTNANARASSIQKKK
jgi:hypothetical protein